jgi:hypothetical protein
MPFQFLHRADPAQLRSFIVDEHPQVIALVLAHMTPDKASLLLSGLAPDQQAQVAHRIARVEGGHAGHERRRDPADRRHARPQLRPVVAQSRSATEDQALLGARHRDMHDAALLGLIGGAALGLDGVEVQHGDLGGVQADEP